jgi:uncharacterized Zn-binding protein involved in type VI secretion
MAGLPAAYTGCDTQHGLPLTGPGSPNVMVNSQPAWTADMPHLCVAHGSETVGMGSETVKINGHRAARGNTLGASGGAWNHAAAGRAGDFLQGAGPPNQILLGSPNVMIGTPAIGVGAPSNLARFCDLYCQLVADWPHLTPADRQRRYEQLLAAMFATFNAPPPTVHQGLDPGAAASFDRWAWQINVAGDAWASARPPSGNTTLHEIRHGEQAFLGMRSGGSQGPRLFGLIGGDAPEHVRAAAARQPLDRDTPEGRFGHLHHDNEFTHLDNRARISSELEAAATAEGAHPTYGSPRYVAAVWGPHGYYNQPGGADARELESPGDCAAQCPQPPPTAAG